MPGAYTIVPATRNHIPIITRHRIGLYTELKDGDAAQIARMGEAFAAWATEQLANGIFHAWLAVDGSSEVAASASVILTPYSPNVIDLNPTRAHVTNVYTDPSHRRRGAARQCVEAAIAFCRERQIKVMTLNASDEGRPLYEKLGFVPTSNMRLLLND